jgi:hypothetical protein
VEILGIVQQKRAMEKTHRPKNMIQKLKSFDTGFLL